MEKFKLISVMVVIMCITGCASTHTAISKRNLDVQTKMSETIFLDPVAPNKRTVFLQIRNTSDKPGLDLSGQIKAAINNKGYQVIDDPEKSHYLLQANILQVGKTDLRASEHAFSQGFNGGLTGAVTGATVGALASNNDRVALGGGLLGAAVGIAADALVKDIVYSIITDIQISERAPSGVTVNEELQSDLKQGTSSKRTVTANEQHNWKRYQTRVVSTANKVNLKFEEALPELIAGISNSIAGVM
jgi:hypothetical protein